MTEASHCRPLPRLALALTLICILYDTNSTTSQSSKRSARSGRPKRRRRKLPAKLTTSGSEPATLEPRMTTDLRLQSTVRCDKLSGFLGKQQVTINCPRLDINRRSLATRRALSTARRAQGFQREWLSITPTATPTTVRVVTAAVTLSRPTARIRKCTNRVIKLKHSLLSARTAVPAADADSPVSNGICVKPSPCLHYQSGIF